jgi:hypothetical protein
MKNENKMPPTSQVVSSDAKLGSESLTFDLSSERATMLTAMFPQGSAARGYTYGDGVNTKGVAGRLEEAEKSIQKRYFKNNPEAFKQWKDEFKPTKQKIISDSWQYEVSQVIHGAKEDNDLALAGAFSALREGFDMTNVSAFFTAGVATEDAVDKHTVATKNMELRNSDNPIADAESDDGKAEALARAEEKVRITAEEHDEIATAEKLYDDKIEIARQHTSDFIAQKHREQYLHAKNVLGRSHEAAVAFANVQMNRHTKKMLQDMVATNPECAKRIITWLSRPDATKIQTVNDKGEGVVDAEGKPVYSSTDWNPLGRWCLSQGEVAELAMSAEAQLCKYEQMQRFKSMQATEQFKLTNASIRMRADRLALASVLDMDQMNMLFAETEKLLGNGFEGAAETSTYLRGIVERAEKKYAKAQKDSARLTTAEDFEREYNDYMAHVTESVPIAFFTKNGSINLGVDASGNPLYADATERIDGQNRLILLIKNGLSRGIIKGEHWTTRLKELEEGRAEEDFNSAMQALNDAGIEIDLDKTAKLADERGGNAGDVGEIAGYSSVWTTDESGRLKLGNPNQIMYTWKDPFNGNYKASISGVQLNALLAEVSKWQRRHANPSPTGEKPEELTRYINNILGKAAIHTVKTHLFSKDERITSGFSDITMAGTQAYREYFRDDKKRGKEYNIRQFYGRDMNLLRGAVMRGEIPSSRAIVESLKKSLEASKK